MWSCEEKSLFSTHECQFNIFFCWIPTSSKFRLCLLETQVHHHHHSRPHLQPRSRSSPPSYRGSSDTAGAAANLTTHQVMGRPESCLEDWAACGAGNEPNIWLNAEDILETNQTLNRQ